MKSIPSNLLVTGLCFLATQAFGQRTLVDGYGVGVGVGMQRYDGSYGSGTSPYVRLLAEVHPLEWLGTRLVLGYGNIGNSDRKPGFETETFSHIGLEFAFQPDLGFGAWRPFLATGIAATFGTAIADRKSPYDLDGNLYLPASLGVEYLFADRWSAWAVCETYAVMQNGDRIDGIRNGTGYFQTRDELQRFVIGGTYRFGSIQSAGQPEPERSASSKVGGDRDGDGVADGADRCPNTPSAMVVDVQGCPSDSDRDRIPDLLDECPSTPIGNRVDETGCTVSNDKDHDGILDAVDRCPGTARTASVDPMGCPIAMASQNPKIVTDSDKDGIPDSRDRCEGTPRGGVVDSTGCVPPPPQLPQQQSELAATASPPTIPEPPTRPLPPVDPENIAAIAPAHVPPPGKSKPVPVATPEKDTDRDGIMDSRDLCRATPVGTKVDSMGCSASTDPDADADKDGVRDFADQCLQSKYGMKVDATGCQILALMKGSQTILEGVFFQAGTARLLEESLPVLEHTARVLKRSAVKVEIAGFTERRGPEGENLSLSQRRAEAVKEHLVTLGTEPGRLSVRGYGSAEPIADNTVEAGRIRNRRIELRVR